MIVSEDRQVAIEPIDEAVTAGACQLKACEVIDRPTHSTPQEAAAA
ncbi:MAG: hypothetical protein ABW168_04520 [Sedimenticola sp.]